MTQLDALQAALAGEHAALYGVGAAGETPAAAEPAYDLPQAVTNAATAAALILLIERRVAAVYGDLVEAAEQAPVRAFAIESLLEAATAQITWGGAPVA